MINLKDQLEKKKANNPQDIKKLFPFIVTKNYKQFSSWHNKEVTYTDYGFKKDNKTFWFNRRTCNLDQYYDYDDIIIICNTLKNSDFKYACTYCGKGCLGSPNKFLNPIDFINWVNKEKHTFDRVMTSIYKVNKDHWVFSGNLYKYSCAFRFHIFSKELLNEIINITGLTLKKIEV